MRRRIRPDDRRSDELLASGRRAYELGLGIGWTAGIIGPRKAKAASERGAFAWKRAARLPGPEQAAELFVRQCRTRNPLVGAGATGALLLEVDGEPELPERFGLVIPETVRVASRRGHTTISDRRRGGRRSRCR